MTEYFASDARSHQSPDEIVVSLDQAQVLVNLIGDVPTKHGVALLNWLNAQPRRKMQTADIAAAGDEPDADRDV